MNKVCYTAIIGNYEELKVPTIISEGWEYICFTDQPFKSDIWKIIPVVVDETPQRMARKIKILPHIYLPDAKETLWVDAAFHIKCDLNNIWQQFKAPFTAPKHPIRDCVYQEIRSCIANKRADESELNIQMDKYKSEGVPAFNGIITSGVLMRQNTPEVIQLCNRWWKEIQDNSPRDQIAFAKVSIGFNFHTFNWNYVDSKELVYIKHYKFRT